MTARSGTVYDTPLKTQLLQNAIIEYELNQEHVTPTAAECYGELGFPGFEMGTGRRER